jgi:nucleotide-binding universal stress UspA family protein
MKFCRDAVLRTPTHEEKDTMSNTQAPRILVALDPSKRPEDPLTLGVRLARLASAPLEVVSVTPETLARPDDRLLRQLHEQAEADLRAAIDRVEGAGVADARVVGAASPARALQQLSEDEGVGVVVIGSTTRGPFKRTLPGSIADRLLSGAAASVAVAPHGFADAAPPRLATLGVAFDGSAESRVALEAGTLLARKAGAHLRVITVHQRLAFGGVSTSAFPLETVSATHERQQRELLDAGVADQAELSIEGVFESGRPVEVLVERSRDLDLLIAGSRGYGPLGAVLLGSTTHDLARLAHCPILITPRGRELTIV